MIREEEEQPLSPMWLPGFHVPSRPVQGTVFPLQEFLMATGGAGLGEAVAGEQQAN